MTDTAKTAWAAVIFDRDGVLNLDHGYVGQVDRLEWVAGAKTAVKRLNAAGVLVLVATNQSGVARGYFDEAAMDHVHAAMQADLAALGARIDRFYVCPFLPDAPVPAYAHPNHPDRKPNPGMILKALADWELDPQAVILVGDKDSDLEAAARSGIDGRLFEGGDLELFLVRHGVLK
jgi:D-glycero-D-manno-heptose 1,7-bisphosphate phosphatase